MNHKPPHAIFFNPTPKMVTDFAKAHPRRFIFTFVSGQVQDVANWKLKELLASDYIVRPIWVGEQLTASIETSMRNFVATILERTS